MIDLNKVIKEFERYVNSYDHDLEQISLKHDHSYQVMKYMEYLANNLHLDEESVSLSKTIGLLHDIGRFEQIKKFASFSDKNQDHADESCNYLFKKGHIRDFSIDEKYDKIIEAAIRYHNKYALPDNLGKEEELFAKMIRDMDKVDIYNQIVKHYEYVFNKDEVSKEALEILKDKKSIPKQIVKTPTDKTLVCLGFIYDFYFKESLAILKQEKSFDKFINFVKVVPNSLDLWNELVRDCYQKIEGGNCYVRKKI